MNAPNHTAHANKFAAILQARQAAGGEGQQDPSAISPQIPPAAAVVVKPVLPKPPRKRGRAAASSSPVRAETVPAQAAPVASVSVGEGSMVKPRVATGRGKSSDPRFRQVTAYIPHDLHTNATIALRLANEVRVDADKQDFSELLASLLAKWFQGQNYYRPNA